MHKKKAGKLQTGSTFPKQYWLAVNGKPKRHLLKMSGPQIWLCLFMFRHIALKQLNGLTTSDNVS